MPAALKFPRGLTEQPSTRETGALKAIFAVRRVNLAHALTSVRAVNIMR